MQLTQFKLGVKVVLPAKEPGKRLSPLELAMTEQTSIENPTAELLTAVTAVVQDAAAHMWERFGNKDIPLTWEKTVETIEANDAEALSILRPGLEKLRPEAGWLEDELTTGSLPAGEWWVVDPLEGAINYAHRTTEFAVTATLVRDNVPVLTVVHLPVINMTYTATQGGGAFRNGERLSTSAKQELAAAMVGTGQASPRETLETFELMGRSLVAMLSAAAVSRVSVPATLQLILVADGRMDVFWQHSSVGSGLLAGALLVQEAGGTVTDLQGRPWSLLRDDFLAATPGVHAAAREALAPPA
jgi:myo-inositol-1(or 4)-monophosphatase